ncbi:unnamed protein product [Spirodela intermedia]|uniref:glycerophosphodiester phosphodiesterase n=1 Tax=Spirodela intermedia TaxID=51605 RepID=A0A7I8II34_SPIIN|nr:unnamed protein product [Spirodela intermedia]CAA6657376.1 unnamed protein product [Spirodela intermedia]
MMSMYILCNVTTTGFVYVLLLNHFLGSLARPLYPLPSKFNTDKQQLQTFRPFNIAHRGSNGEFPEETAASYVRAIEEGADFLETDILASKDGVLICFHDVILDNTTNVADYKEFSDRQRTYEVQGDNITGWFVVDFTIAELKTLKVKQRYKFRDQQYNGKFSIITFEEFISIALDAPRVVGIYPEIKNPVFINQHVKWLGGKRFEDIFVDILLRNGYKGPYMSDDWLKQPVFMQSFAPTSLVYASKLIDSPKILLIDDSYWEITSESYFEYIKEYVVGIGPWKDTVWTPMDLPQVHPYTYRNENQFLHFDFHQDPYAEYEFWINQMGVDGLFTDFTGSLHRYQEWTSFAAAPNASAADRLLHRISLLIDAYRGK